ncbi:hypothetical protein GHZ99_002167 [Neisseria gonorrhoeae]
MWSGKFEYQCQHGGDGGNQTGGRHHGIPAGLLGYFYGFGVDFVRVGNDFGDFGIYFS